MRSRPILSVVALLLATLLAPIVIVGMWTESKVAHTDAYVASVAPLAEDPALREQFGNALGASVAEMLAERSPVGSPPFAGDLIKAAAVAVVNEPGFPAFWRKANRDVHRQFLAVMHERPGDRTGLVFVDATPLLNDVFARLAQRGLQVQPLAGTPLRIPVATDARLEQGRTAYTWLNRVATLGPFLWLALVAGAVLLASGWRGRLRALAFGAGALAVVALVIIAGRSSAESFAASHAGVGNTDLVRLLLGQVLEGLSTYARNIALVAVPVALVALLGSLVGRPRGR
ncbi:serine/threonine-protein kinase [Nocardioides montaniterrae]